MTFQHLPAAAYEWWKELCAKRKEIPTWMGYVMADVVKADTPHASENRSVGTQMRNSGLWPAWSCTKWAIQFGGSTRVRSGSRIKK